MTRTMRFALLACLAVCSTSAIASRVPDVLSGIPWLAMGKSANSLTHHDSDMGIVAFTFTVPPNVADEFVDKWDEMIGSQASKAKGNIKIGLSRPIISNAVYLDYSEWESMDDFACWFKGSDSRDFRDYAADRDIVWEWEFLLQSSGSYTKPATAPADPTHHKDSSFSVLSTINVKPHHVHDFVKAWQDAAEETAHERGNKAYALHRVASNNAKFYVYGSWESESDWKDHHEARYVNDLADWADDHDVVFVESPLHYMSKYMYNTKA